MGGPMARRSEKASRGSVIAYGLPTHAFQKFFRIWPLPLSALDFRPASVKGFDLKGKAVRLHGSA